MNCMLLIEFEWTRSMGLYLQFAHGTAYTLELIKLDSLKHYSITKLDRTSQSRTTNYYQSVSNFISIQLSIISEVWFDRYQVFCYDEFP